MGTPRQTFDPGLTEKFSGDLRRVINPDGTFNVRRRGEKLESANPYLYLIDITWPRFIAIVLSSYLLVNLLFAFLFVAVGIQNLAGEQVNDGLSPFASAFFFSVHTLTTVGYGSVYPRGYGANIVAGIEAMVGLMGFALATGLLYGRFSRPSARIVFSESMLVAPYQGGTSIQFRIANGRKNNLVDVQATILLMLVERCDGELQRRYADLTLERKQVYFFPLTWTVVHPINEQSPLFGKTAADLATQEAEFLIVIKGFDETFAQVVNSRYSYRHDELVWGAKFTQAFLVDQNGDMILELDQINAQKRVDV